jgi:peptidoglycan/xylan/chitin deacetylase (PgdA/CDA1 family)
MQYHLPLFLGILQKILKGILLSSLSLIISLLLANAENAAAAQESKPFVRVLCYHHIIPGPLPQGATTHAVIPLSEFEAQMKYLYDAGYYTASFEDVADFIYKKKILPEKTVLISFDDGYESNYVYAYPILKKYNFRAVIFLIGSRISDKNGPYDPNKLSMLTSSQIKEMFDSGLVEFGSHTFNAHEYIGAKPALLSMDKTQIEEDFALQAGVFAKNGIPAPSAIAYPFGRFNGNAKEAAKKFGYTLGFTIMEGFVYQDSNPYALNRIIVPPGTGISEFKSLLKDSFPEMPPDYKNSIVLQINSRTAYMKGRPFLLDACPFIENGVTMVPLRFISQSLGARVEWLPAERKILVVAPETTVELRAEPPLRQSVTQSAPGLPLSEAIVNGKNIFLDTPPIIKNDRIMVPLRFLSETLGFEVKWRGPLKMVEIKLP